MENVIKLRVPVVAELSLGTSWGNGIKIETVEDWYNRDGKK